MYDLFVKKIIKHLFGKDNPIAVSQHFTVNKKTTQKNTVFIYLVPGDKWIARLIGKNGTTIKLIENLVKIKGYLNNCQAIIKLENK